MVKVLGGLFGKQADRVAIIYKDMKISYSDVQKNVEKYACYLKGLGVNKGDCVALSCQNSPDFVYSYFGVVQTGAAVIPMNLLLTINEIQFIFGDAKVKTWIVHRVIFEKIGMPKEKIMAALGLKNLVIIDEEFTSSIKVLEHMPAVQLNDKDLCTILYTSGTTGKPKGVMLTHGNLLANAHSIVNLLEVNEQDKLLCVLPFFHTFGFMVSVLTPLYSGATMIILEAFHPKEVIHNLIEKEVTVFSGVPSMYVLLNKFIQKQNLSFPHIRYAVSGGAPLPSEVGKELLSRFPMAEGYGLTEASPVVSFNYKGDIEKLGSIGVPLPGLEVKIIDDYGNSLPVGLVGELVVRGPSVMKGYLNQIEETKRTIINGWLHTGDLARMDKDGYIYIVDRKKDLIISSGFNVYPREVEEVLYEHPDVFECAVIGVEDGVRGEVVKAVIVPKEEKLITKEDILVFLKDRLASYKVPRIIEFAESLPKNSTGKILKRKIRAVG